MINYIRKFGVWEYILFASGLLVLGKLTYNFLTDTLENTALNGIAFLVSILMMSAPTFLVKKIKEKASNISKK